MTDIIVRPILLVEEHTGDARGISEYLLEKGESGYRLDQVARLSEALDLLAEKRYAAVLFELNLPDSAGMATFHQIYHAAPDTALIMMTGTDDPSSADQVIQAGAQDYLVKGQFDSALLNRTLRYAIDRKQAEITLRESQQAYLTLVSNLPGMAFRARAADHTLELVSPGSQAITGYQPEDLVENCKVSYLELIHPEDRDKVLLRIQIALNRRRPYQLKYRISDASGRVRWVSEQGRETSETMGSESGHTIEGYISDITLEMESNAALEQSLSNIHSLRLIDRAILARLDQRDVLNVILEQATTALPVDAAAILLAEPEGGCWVQLGSLHFRGKSQLARRLEANPWSANLPTRFSLVDLAARPDLAVQLRIEDEGFRMAFGASFKIEGQRQGFLEVFSRADCKLTFDQVEFLEALAGQAAVALTQLALNADLERKHSELVDAYESTIEGWALTLEMRDRETEDHTRRVTEMTVRLAEHLKIPAEECVHIHRGALLHDIGKIGIPDSILLKPGPLTDEEWVIMRTHPDLAYKHLKPIRFLQPALDIPYCHHEHWDGSGYPRGLKGEEIPLAARIFAVVDVWDALTSDRPYRKAWNREETLAYIQSKSGIQFDPQVVSALRQILMDHEKPA